MKPIILAMAKRFIEKTITTSDDSFMADVSVKFVGNGNILEIKLFNKERDNRAYWFSNSKSDNFLKYQYKKVLKLINRRVIEW